MLNLDSDAQCAPAKPIACLLEWASGYGHEGASGEWQAPGCHQMHCWRGEKLKGWLLLGIARVVFGQGCCCHCKPAFWLGSLKDLGQWEPEIFVVLFLSNSGLRLPHCTLEVYKFDGPPMWITDPSSFIINCFLLSYHSKLVFKYWHIIQKDIWY